MTVELTFDAFAVAGGIRGESTVAVVDFHAGKVQSVGMARQFTGHAAAVARTKIGFDGTGIDIAFAGFMTVDTDYVVSRGCQAFGTAGRVFAIEPGRMRVAFDMRSSGGF